MDISSVTSSYSISVSTTTVSSNAAVGNMGMCCDGDNDGGEKTAGLGRHHHHDGGGAFMQSVMQTFSQMGINLPGAPTPAAQAAASSETTRTAAASAAATVGATGAASTGTVASDAGQNIRQAMHTFMHDLFQALRQINQTPAHTGTDSGGKNDGSGAITSIQSKYANLDSGLQKLIKQIGAENSSSSANSVVDKLQSDFQNLLNTINGASASSGSTPKSADLKTFLQNLDKNLQSWLAVNSSLGGVINTTA